jgi:hypothetical protein
MSLNIIKYSRILLIQYPRDQQDARLSNIVFHIIKQYLHWTNFLQVFLSVTAPTLWLHNYSNVYSTWLSPSAAASGVLGSLYIYISFFLEPLWVSSRCAEGPVDWESGVSIPLEIGVRDKGSGYTTRINVETILHTFPEPSRLWDYLP